MNMSVDGHEAICAKHARGLGRFLSLSRLSRSVLLIVLAGLFGHSAAIAQTYKGPNMNYSYSGPRVSEQDVFNNPNDRQLNLNYARQQSASGDLLSAASTLERLLVLEPNWHSARLFYAAVLYRLDDRQAANRELELLEGRNLNESQQATFNDYKTSFQYAAPITAQRAIDGRLVADIEAEQTERAAAAARGQSAASPGLISPDLGAVANARLAIGLRLDNNAGNAIDDVTLAQNNSADSSVFGQAAVRGSLSLADNNRLRAHGSLNGQMRRHQEFSSSDYDTVSVKAGLTAYTADLRASVMAEMQHDVVDISGEDYLTQTGPRLAVRYKATPDVTVSLSGSLLDQDYENLPTSPTESERSGDKSVILAGLSVRLNDKARIALSGGVENKTARNDALAYDGIRLSADYIQKLTDSLDIKANLRYRSIDFENFGTDGLEETRLNARIALSVDLANLIDVASALGGPKFETGLNFNRRDYNIAGSDYDNMGAEMRLTWDF